MKTDFLVIGSGIAGLTFALKVAQECPNKKVTILTKTQSDETNTKYAQGGIAGVMDFDQDSFTKHIKHTLVAGDGLCNEYIVEIVVKEGVNRINELIEWGAKFDKEPDGDYKLGKEGGHSESRILHHKDVTGKEMERALLEAIKRCSNIQLISHCFVIDLITQHHLGFLVTKSTPDIECYGVYILNLGTNKIEKIEAGITMLAAGGNGQVYRSTTNPAIATGDGVAMLYRAKGRIENMEFIQFHPTALYEPGVRGHSFLITEAVRGDGARRGGPLLPRAALEGVRRRGHSQSAGPSRARAAPRARRRGGRSHS
jgi:L-aspartate oxidase